MIQGLVTQLIQLAQSQHPQDKLAMAKKMAWLLDGSIGIPGTKAKIGLDPILGMFPILGDLIPVVLSLYIINIAKELGVPRHQMRIMYFNIVVDTIVGFIPLIGDAIDAFWKSNLWNIGIIERHLAKHSQTIPFPGHKLGKPRHKPAAAAEQIIDVVATHPQAGKS